MPVVQVWFLLLQVAVGAGVGGGLGDDEEGGEVPPWLGGGVTGPGVAGVSGTGGITIGG